MAQKRRRPPQNPRRRRPQAVSDPQQTDFVDDFVLELLRTSFMFYELLCNLTEDLPEDAYPGEDKGGVVIDMLKGTLRPVVEDAGELRVRQARRLLDDCADKVIADLRAALALRIAMDRGAQHG